MGSLVLTGLALLPAVSLGDMARRATGDHFSFLVAGSAGWMLLALPGGVTLARVAGVFRIRAISTALVLPSIVVTLTFNAAFGMWAVERYGVQAMDPDHLGPAILVPFLVILGASYAALSALTIGSASRLSLIVGVAAVGLIGALEVHGGSIWDTQFMGV